MRLVMLYTVGDGCTWHADVVQPITIESAEFAIVDFEKKCFEAQAAKHLRALNGGNFTWCEHEFDADQFFFEGKYYSPEFLTIDEWFERNNQPDDE